MNDIINEHGTSLYIDTLRHRVLIDGDGLAFFLLGEDPEVVDAASATQTPELLRAAILDHLRKEPQFAKRLDGTAGATQSIDLDVALDSIQSDATLRPFATAPHVRNAVVSTGARCGRPVRRDHGGVYEPIARRTEYLITKLKLAGLEPSVCIPSESHSFNVACAGSYLQHLVLPLKAHKFAQLVGCNVEC